MNFLDPVEWNNLDELEKEYDPENLTEELIGRLHDRCVFFALHLA